MKSVDATHHTSLNLIRRVGASRLVARRLARPSVPGG